MNRTPLRLLSAIALLSACGGGGGGGSPAPPTTATALSRFAYVAAQDRIGVYRVDDL